MIWFPIIPPHIHTVEYYYLSREVREMERKYRKCIKVVGTVFLVIGFVLFSLLVLALVVACL